MLIVPLVDSVVTLYPLPDLVPPTPLAQTRKAFSFSVNSTVERVSADGKVQSFDDVASGQASGVPTVVTYLVVGSQRKLVVYCWRDGEADPVRVRVLPAQLVPLLRLTVCRKHHCRTPRESYRSSSQLFCALRIPLQSMSYSTLTPCRREKSRCLSTFLPPLALEHMV